MTVRFLVFAENRIFEKGVGSKQNYFSLCVLPTIHSKDIKDTREYLTMLMNLRHKEVNDRLQVDVQALYVWVWVARVQQAGSTCFSASFCGSSNQLTHSYRVSFSQTLTEVTAKGFC